MSADTVAQMVQVREFFGIPVRFNPEMIDHDADGHPYHGIAFARGFWPLKRIEVGRGWFRLRPGEQDAALAHEAGHCFCRHLEKRLLLAPLCWLPAVQRWARAQELEADGFAVREGYASALLRLLASHPSPGNALMPSGQERATNILRLLQERQP